MHVSFNRFNENYMNRTFLYILVILSLLSCNQNKLPEQSAFTNRSEMRLDSIGDPVIESNLTKQLNEYLDAMWGGNIDKAIDYCYSDMFIWMKNELPEQYSMDLVKGYFKQLMEDFRSQQAKSGLEIEFKIGDIIKRIDLGQDKIYMIVTYIKGKKGYDEYSLGDVTIAISNNNGKDWKFLAREEESTPPIIRMKYSEEIVQEIMKKD